MYCICILYCVSYVTYNCRNPSVVLFTCFVCQTGWQVMTTNVRTLLKPFKAVVTLDSCFRAKDALLAAERFYRLLNHLDNFNFRSFLQQHTVGFKQ